MLRTPSVGSFDFLSASKHGSSTFSTGYRESMRDLRGSHSTAARKSMVSSMGYGESMRDILAHESRVNEHPTPEDLAAQKRNRLILATFSALSTLFLAGATLGWGPMQLMLEANGTFNSKCDGVVDEDGICPSQTSTLLRISIIMGITQMFSPVLGYTVDKIGAPNFAAAQAVIALFGMLLVAIGMTVDDAEVLVYLGFPMLSICTWMGSLLIIQLGFYFVGHAQARIIFVLNTLFDSGALTYLLLWVVQEQADIATNAVWVGYTVFAGVVYAITVALWRIAVQEEERVEEKDLEIPGNAFPREKEILANSSSKVAVETEHNSDDEKEKKKENKDRPELEDVVEVEGKEETPDYVLVADRSTKEQLTSGPFMLLCVFFGLQVASNQWNFATQRDFLAHLGDDDKDNRYLTIFTLMTPVSFLGVPLIDYCILHYGWATSMQVINALAVAYTTIKLVSDDLNVQIVGFIIFSFFRSFLFGVSFSFLPTLVAGPMIGVAAGVMASVPGAISFISIPMAALAVETFDGDFFWPNLVYALLTIPCIAAISVLGTYLKKEEEAKLFKGG